MNKKSIKNVAIKGKKVIMRADFNVPLDKNINITDDNRIRASIPTIKYILDRGGKLILMSHLGRPKGEIKEDMRLTPVGIRLSELLAQPVQKLDYCIGPEVERVASSIKTGEVVLLENLRFHKAETENDPVFAKKLASLADLFVNDAFGTCHRAHASTVGITKYLESVAGLLVEKEIKYFEKINSAPEHPFVLILGGAKVSDKIPVIENLIPKVDTILIGGAMAYSFLKQKGINIGSSRHEDEMVSMISNINVLAEDRGVEIILPADHVVCDDFLEPQTIFTTKDINIEEGYMGMDIGPKTVELFLSRLKGAKTILWNGPMGVFEREDFVNGTKNLALAIAASSATSVIGGGDSAAAAKKFDLETKMSHISTGGGASLEYLEGKLLPGIAALSDL